MHFRLGVTALLGAGLLAASAITSSAQAALRLEALTVPAGLLPAGCQLGRLSKAPVDPPPLGYRDNPWIGTSREYATSIRMRVDGDLGPTYGLSDPALWARLAEDVIESYHAVYGEARGSRIDVDAVRFKDPKLALAATTNPVIDHVAARIVRGATAVIVYRYPSEWTTVDRSGEACFRTIHDYVASLK
jgi:hypothetical protein